MSEKAMGIDFILQVNTGTVDVPVWTTVAGQKGGKLNRSVDTIDSTTKDSGSDKEFEYGFREWSIDADGLIVEDDAGYMALEDAYTNLTKLQAQMVTPAGNKYSGSVLLVDFPTDAPYNDNATYSVKLQGTGALTKVTV